MNIGVTIQTCPGIELARRTAAVETGERRIGSSRMSACIMAVLAELRRILDQKFGMVAAVRCMAVEAVFLDRRMFEHEGASLFGVTLIAQFVDRIGFDLIVAESTMRIVAIGACDQPFLDRMMGLSVHL